MSDSRDLEILANSILSLISLCDNIQDYVSLLNSSTFETIDLDALQSPSVDSLQEIRQSLIPIVANKILPIYFYSQLNETTMYSCSYMDGLLSILYITLLNRRNKPYTALLASDIYFNLITLNGATAHKIIRGSIFREMLYSISNSIKYNKNDEDIVTDQNSPNDNDIDIETQNSQGIYTPSQTITQSQSITTQSQSITASSLGLKSKSKRINKEELITNNKNYVLLHPLLFKFPSLLSTIDRIVINMSWNIFCDIANDILVNDIYQDAAEIFLTSIYNYCKIDTNECLGDFFKCVFKISIFKKTQKNCSNTAFRTGYDLLLNSLVTLLKQSNIFCVPIYAFIQRMILSCPDKQDLRSVLVTSVTKIVLCLPPLLKKRLNHFILIVSKSNSINRRLCAVDLCCNLILSSYILDKQEDTDDNINVEEEEEDDGGNENLKESLQEPNQDQQYNVLFNDNGFNLFLNIIIKRARDIAPTIRSRSAICLSQILIYTFDYENKEGKSMKQDDIVKQLKLEINSDYLSIIYTICKELLVDSKSICRKNSLILYRSLVIYASYPPMITLQEDLPLFSQTCSDPSVTVRKTAIQTLFDIYTYSSISILYNSIWFPTVLSCISDNENSIQEMAIDTIKSNIFDNIIVWYINMNKKMKENVKESTVINAEKNDENNEKIGIEYYLYTNIETLDGFKVWLIMEQYEPSYELLFSKCISDSCQRNSINGPQIIKYLISIYKWCLSYIDKYTYYYDLSTKSTDVMYIFEFKEKNFIHINKMIISIWLLLSNLSKIYAGQVNHEFISEAIYNKENNEIISNPCVSVYIYTTLLNIVNKLKYDEINEYMTFIYQQIQSFHCDIQIIHLLVKIYSQLSLLTYTTLPKLKAFLTQQVQFLYSRIIAVLKEYIFGTESSRLHSIDVIQYLFTAGELSLIGAEEKEECILANISIPIPNDLLMSVQSLYSSSLPLLAVSQNHTYSQALSQNTPSNNTETIIPSQIRAHAFITFGKFCLQNASLAKKNISMYIRELTTSTDPVIRNNILIILGDLCKRHTSIVERYIPTFCTCIIDKEKIIRIHALSIINNLVMENYFKVKPLLLYYFLLGTADDDVEVKVLANQIIESQINTIYPKAIPNSIIEIMILLNGCTYLPLFKIEEGIEKYKPVYSGNNPIHVLKRNRIYRGLLSITSDENKLLISTKLCQNILGPMADETLPVPDSTNKDDPYLNLVKDTFNILCSQEIKITAVLPNDNSDANVVPGTPVMPTQLLEAKSKVLNKIHKKAVIDQILPLLVSLKHKLDSNQSSLIRELMLYFKVLFASYKKELMEFLSSDPHLQRELEYDMRQFEDSSKSDTLQDEVLTKINTLATPLISKSINMSNTYALQSLTSNTSGLLGTTNQSEQTRNSKEEIQNMVVPATPLLRHSLSGGPIITSVSRRQSRRESLLAMSVVIHDKEVTTNNGDHQVGNTDTTLSNNQNNQGSTSQWKIEVQSSLDHTLPKKLNLDDSSSSDDKDQDSMNKVTKQTSLEELSSTVTPIKPILRQSYKVMSSSIPEIQSTTNVITEQNKSIRKSAIAPVTSTHTNGLSTLFDTLPNTDHLTALNKKISKSHNIRKSLKRASLQIDGRNNTAKRSRISLLEDSKNSNQKEIYSKDKENSDNLEISNSSDDELLTQNRNKTKQSNTKTKKT